MHHWQIMEIGRRLNDFIDDLGRDEFINDEKKQQIIDFFIKHLIEINIIHHQTEIEISENLLNRILNHHQWRQIIDGDNYKFNENDSLHQ